MAAEIPTYEPEEFTRGDTVKWKINLPDYAPQDGWTLKYSFVTSSGQVDVTGTDNGDGYHLVTIDSTTSQSFSAGDWSWQAYVEKAGERYTVRRGTLVVKEDFASQTSGYDARTHVKKVLDALEATILGKATSDQLSYTIAGRSLSRMSPSELIHWRDIYRAEYEREKRAERIRRGLGHKGVVRVRFG
jgi:hypothetical protein